MYYPMNTYEPRWTLGIVRLEYVELVKVLHIKLICSVANTNVYLWKEIKPQV